MSSLQNSKNPHHVIQNKVKDLEWHETRTWSKRDRYKINKIIVHQSLTDSTTKGVNNYHIKPNHISSRGLPHIGYHYAIERSGEIIWCNLVEHMLAHSRGQNAVSIGIVLHGNFDGPGYDKGTQEPTEEQLKSLQFLLDYLINFDLADIGLTYEDVYGHCDFGKPACPGTIAYEKVKEIKALQSRTA